MSNTINGRTPEEIKKGLELCTSKCISNLACPYNEHGDGCATYLNKDALAYIQQLERERDVAVERCVNADDVSAGYYHEIQQLESAQPKWISVEDELPPVGERVLALNGHSVFESFIDCQDVWHRSPTCYELKGNVTHWMPLPKPPEEEA